jgi:hypothetical protein
MALQMAFFVRSAYHLGKEAQEALAAQSSSSKLDQFAWKTLWALTVPNAVKIFSWRACHKVLPTKENLRRRKVLEEASCPFCLSEKRNTNPCNLALSGCSRRVGV